ncbi:MAG: hypothetical protein M3430_05510 [Acidobacteriota bacterium]|nr:hypothetical protein [Acidobacteriota bacterium]
MGQTLSENREQIIRRRGRLNLDDADAERPEKFFTGGDGRALLCACVALDEAEPEAFGIINRARQTAQSDVFRFFERLYLNL